MDCKEIERLIPKFLDNELSGKELLNFLEHVNKCEDCKEELTIQYLASEGIARLEEGKTFDLDRELSEYMHSTVKKQNFQKYLRIGIIVGEVTAIIVILLIFVYALR